MYLIDPATFQLALSWTRLRLGTETVRRSTYDKETSWRCGDSAPLDATNLKDGDTDVMLLLFVRSLTLSFKAEKIDLYLL